MQECSLAVENARLDVLAHPDSQVIDQEVLNAGAIGRMLGGTPSGGAATNLITRHITVTSSTIAIIDEISGGWAVLCMVIGDSAVRNTEQEPA